MSGSGQMTEVWKKRLWWANGRFTRPGLHLWLVGRHWRVLPMPRRRMT